MLPSSLQQACTEVWLCTAGAWLPHCTTVIIQVAGKIGCWGPTIYVLSIYLMLIYLIPSHQLSKVGVINICNSDKENEVPKLHRHWMLESRLKPLWPNSRPMELTSTLPAFLLHNCLDTCYKCRGLGPIQRASVSIGLGGAWEPIYATSLT